MGHSTFIIKFLINCQTTMFFNQVNNFIIFVNVFQYCYKTIVLLYYKDTGFR